MEGKDKINGRYGIMFEDLNKGLVDFLRDSHSCFHAVRIIKEKLAGCGFCELKEDKYWKLEPGKGYYLTRNSSSLLAFRVPEKETDSIHIVAAHSDSPSFKIKPNPEMDGCGDTVLLNIEKYGGMLTAPWFDRPLTAAGRILAEEDGRISEKLVYIDKDLFIIPSLAIHMDREANDRPKSNVQTEMPPLFASRNALQGDDKDNKAWKKDAFLKLVARETGVEAKKICASDLYLTVRMEPSVWGTDGEYISARGLDDLECCYCALSGFVSADVPKDGVMPMLCIFDNEEVGSRTRQGAESDLLSGTVGRICSVLGKTGEEHRMLIAKSFMISADNAHAVHPLHPEKADPVNRPQLNKGVVLKHHAGAKYTTDAVSAALIKKLCADHDIPLQEYTNRSDIPGGSTLGNISGTQVSLSCADIGLAQLAMHSCYETAGARDPEYLARLSKAFFEEELPEIYNEG